MLFIFSDIIYKLKSSFGKYVPINTASFFFIFALFFKKLKTEKKNEPTRNGYYA